MTNNSRFYFVLLSVSAAIGLGNIWLYPFVSFKSTGLLFVPYIAALLILGAPLLMLELSIGQYFGKNAVDLFASAGKWFSAIGWYMIFNAFIVMSYFAVILSWHIIYFFVSFGLQYSNDPESYFFNNVIQLSEGFSGFTQVSMPVFTVLLIVWVLVFLYIKSGIDSVKKGFLIMLPVFVALLLGFLLYSLTLDSALAGVYAFLKPDFMALLSLDIWVAAFYLAAVSLGLSFGVFSAFARKSRVGFIVGNSVIVVIFEFLTSIVMGFILFGIIGFLNADLNTLVFSDFGSPFITFTHALPLFYKPTLLSLLFFAFLSMFFVFAAVSLAYSISDVLVKKLKTKKINAAIIVSGFGFLFGLLFVIKPGFFIMDIVNHFVQYNVLLIILLETVAFGWFFDMQKLSNYINQHSYLKIGGLFKFFVRYIAPLVLLLLLFLQLHADYYAGYRNYAWQYIMIFGVGAVALPLVASLLMPQRLLDRR